MWLGLGGDILIKCIKFIRRYKVHGVWVCLSTVWRSDDRSRELFIVMWALVFASGSFTCWAILLAHQFSGFLKDFFFLFSYEMLIHFSFQVIYLMLSLTPGSELGKFPLQFWLVLASFSVLGQSGKERHFFMCLLITTVKPFGSGLFLGGGR